MNAGDIAIQNQSIARRVLLDPYGLDEAHLQRALADIFTHRVDYADLYFQYTRNEAWSLEEGIVKSGSFSIDQGVGVRAVSGEKTAFAYSDDISEAALIDAARTVRTIAAAGQERRVQVGAHTTGPSLDLYPVLDPIASLDSAAKVGLLERVERKARAKDPRIQQVMAGLAAEYDVVLVARADGTRSADVRPLVRLSVTVIAEHNGRREIGSGFGQGQIGCEIDFVDSPGAVAVWPAHADFPIDAPWTQDRRINEVRAVGGEDDDDVGQRINAIHLRAEHRHQCGSQIIGPAAAPRAQDAFRLIDKEEGKLALGSAFTALGKEVPHLPLALAHPHIENLGAFHVQEKLRAIGTGAGFDLLTQVIGRCLAQQRLAAARRPI